MHASGSGSQKGQHAHRPCQAPEPNPTPQAFRRADHKLNVIGVGLLGITTTQYYNQTVGAVGLADFGVGILKGTIFGSIVALAGCLRGMQCGRSASAVGQATTSAVVTAIVFIIVADALLNVIVDVLGV